MSLETVSDVRHIVLSAPSKMSSPSDGQQLFSRLVSSLTSSAPESSLQTPAQTPTHTERPPKEQWAVSDLADDDLSRLLEALQLEQASRASGASKNSVPSIEPLKVFLYDLEVCKLIPRPIPLICTLTHPYLGQTTGLGKTSSLGIVEIGGIILTYTDSVWKSHATFHSLVRPKKKVKNQVPHDIHTSPDDLEKPTFEELRPRLESFLEEEASTCSRFIVAAHNGKRYDHRILCFHKLKPPAKSEWGDTIDWFKKRRPQLNSYSVSSLHPGGPPPAAHRVSYPCKPLVSQSYAFFIRDQGIARLRGRYQSYESSQSVSR